MVSLSADASADSIEEKVLLFVEAVRSLPLESLKTAAVDPIQDVLENEASVLLFVHPLGGGCQEAFLTKRFKSHTFLFGWLIEQTYLFLHSILPL
ncbi:hypothetical protein PIB30_073549 [Stylosanthes scabra]|uniref:Uncharacterized protein n=1 Tax=Stylosanthes scabra TaxID=79078 RepID=A0ABU6YQR6_9FABA|nr:hypothetical protein [Stylosanthes scabra]